MLLIMPRSYVIEYCIASFNKETKQKAFETYIATAVEIIAENTSRINGGKTMNRHYSEIFKKRDTRTGKEIAEEVLRKIQHKTK